MSLLDRKSGVGYFIEQDAQEKILKFRREHFLTKTVSEFLRMMRLLDISVDELKNMDDPKK